MFTKKNYIVPISFSLTASGMHPISCIFETDAGPNMLGEELVEPDRLTLHDSETAYY